MRTRGHFTFGHNYRLSELAGAVARAQLAKLDRLSARRRELVAVVEETLGDVPGLELAQVYPETEPSYWLYPVRVPARLGTACEVNYLEEVYRQMQRERRTSLGIPLPDYVQYRPGLCPQAEAGTSRLRTLNVQPTNDPESLRQTAEKLREAVLSG